MKEILEIATTIVAGLDKARLVFTSQGYWPDRIEHVEILGRVISLMDVQEDAEDPERKVQSIDLYVKEREGVSLLDVLTLVLGPPSKVHHFYATHRRVFNWDRRSTDPALGCSPNDGVFIVADAHSIELFQSFTKK